MLRLLEGHDSARVGEAVTAAMQLAVVDADAVRLLLEKSLERPPAAFDLTGRPHLSGAGVRPPDLSAYAALTSTPRPPA